MLNSLNEPTRWRNHSRATKIGQRMWNRNALCSNGVPCRSRIRKRISPSSDSSISVFRRAKLTRAPFTTDRSSAIASSRRTNPWSRTGIVSSVSTSTVVVIGRKRLLRDPDGIVSGMAKLDAIGIVTGDLAASLRFYALLGVDVPSGDGDHVEAALPGGLRLMWDTEDLIRKIDPEW